MSADGSIELPFGDGLKKFRLAIGQWRVLEEKRKLGPKRLYDRVRSGDWLVEDLYQTIRLGLVGGGMSEPQALELTEAFFGSWLAERGLLGAEGICVLVMGVSLVGMDGDPVGKPEAGGRAKKSGSPASTATVPRPAASRRRKSTK